MCKEDKMICSNEGRTYPTICSLNEEAIERGEPDTYFPKLFMEYWGPCKEGKLFCLGTRETYPTILTYILRMTLQYFF